MTSSTSDQYPDALRVGTALGEFTITDVIGEGGFGTVYLAYEETLDRTVAIKEYLPVTIAARSGDQTVLVRSEVNRDAYAAGLQSFMREARLQARFSHPAMLEVYRVWEQNGTAYMAMRYYPGESLRDLRRNTASSITIDEAWIKRILLPVFDAVRELHSQSVLHRDVSPDNILILPSGAPVLLDFGAARMVVAGAAQSLTTVLKPGYAPIEQYAGDGAMEQGPWTDVYGLGAVLYFLATGSPPPQAVTRMLGDTLRAFDERVSGCYSEAFATATKGALAVRPENRLQSVTALIEALGWDDAEPLYPATTNVTVKYTPAEVPQTVHLQPATAAGQATTLLSSSLSSVALEPTFTAPATDARATAAIALTEPLAPQLPSSASPVLQRTDSDSRSPWRSGAWLLAASLLLGVAYIGFEKLWRAELTQPAPPTSTNAAPASPTRPSVQKDADVNSKGNPPPIPARTEQPASTVNGAKAETTPARATESAQGRPAAPTPKSKVAASSATPPIPAKSISGAGVPADRSGCERIFAKLSLGTAELSATEQQKLAACK